MTPPDSNEPNLAQIRWIMEQLQETVQELQLRTLPELRTQQSDLRRQMDEHRLGLEGDRRIRADRDDNARQLWQEIRERIKAIEQKVDMLQEHYQSLRSITGLPTHRTSFAELDWKILVPIGGGIAYALYELFRPGVQS
jgi:DNA repair exonuclease SbcCD ATPase subunit